MRTLTIQEYVANAPVVVGPKRCPHCKRVEPQLFDGLCAVCCITTLKCELSEANVKLDRISRAGTLVEAK